MDKEEGMSKPAYVEGGIPCVSCGREDTISLVITHQSNPEHHDSVTWCACGQVFVHYPGLTKRVFNFKAEQS
jgi:hypothetical protein